MKLACSILHKPNGVWVARHASLNLEIDGCLPGLDTVWPKQGQEAIQRVIGMADGEDLHWHSVIRYLLPQT